MKTKKFNSGKEMLEYIQAGNDLYNPSRGYVWVYNEYGSIACGSIDEDHLIEIGQEAAEAGDKADDVFSEMVFGTINVAFVTGTIYDAPSYGWRSEHNITNLEFCETLFDEDWVDAKEYIRLSKVICGTIEVDVELTREGYDVYIAHDGNSGLHYTGKNADEIGKIIAEEIDLYAEGGQEGVKESARIPIPEGTKPAKLVFTDGAEISYVDHPTIEAAREALAKEYAEVKEDHFGDIGDNELENGSFVAADSAKLFTDEGLLIWQVIA